MKKTNHAWAWVAVAAALLLALAGCDAIPEELGGTTDEESPLKLTGTSGNEVNMNGTWSRGCFSDPPESENDSLKIDGSSFDNTFSIWLSVADCSGTADFAGKFGGKITSDQAVTITGWDPAAPAGLEAVTTANGMTVTFKSGSLTPNTQAGADALNAFGGFCGFTDWAVGVEKDVLTCFLTDDAGTVQPATWKESEVIDDSAAQLKWYSSEQSYYTTALDAAGYPTVIDASDPNLK